MTQQTMRIKKIFGLTIQGEGLFSGQASIFIRTEGCNIWNGQQETKSKSQCPYCDTDFINGIEMTIEEILKEVMAISKQNGLLIVITGGEPLTQDIKPLCEKLLSSGYRIQIETNGTKDFKMEGVSVSMSPKVPFDKIKLKECDTLKVLFPHPNKNIIPENFNNPLWGTKYKSLQPIDDGDFSSANQFKCLDKVLQLGGEWRIGLQIHKIIGVD